MCALNTATKVPDPSPVIGDQVLGPIPLQEEGRGKEANGTGLELLRARKLTVKEAAKMIGVGETKMREFVRNGEIPTLLIDGKYLLLERDLEDFLRRRYGALKPVTVQRQGMPSLPKDIAESGLLKRPGRN
jgi:excisionase family DNA binding protein